MALKDNPDIWEDGEFVVEKFDDYWNAAAKYCKKFEAVNNEALAGEDMNITFLHTNGNFIAGILVHKTKNGVCWVRAPGRETAYEVVEENGLYIHLGEGSLRNKLGDLKKSP